MSSTGFNTSFGASNQYNLFNATSGSDKKNPIEHKKIFCAYHSTQFLTNFCIDKECLMPLCPTCVVEHTQQHYQCQQKPTYVNLNDAMQESKQRCYSNIIQLQEYNRKNLELSNYIQGLPDYIRKQLSQCKQKLYRFIDQKFDDYENKVIQEIREKYAEEGVYSRKQCDQLRNFIEGQIEGLYEKISQLKGDQCLAALIRYYESDQKCLEEELTEIADYIQKNKRAGGLYISLNTQQMIKQFENICEKVVQLEYVQQDQKSFASGRQSQNQQSSGMKKGVMTSSNVNRVSVSSNSNNKSATKEKTQKVFGNGQGYTSYKQKQGQKNYYNSPFRNSPQF